MTRARYSDVITDPTGRPIPGATVELFNVGTTTAITGPIYAAATGATTKTNPIVVDAEGEIEFYLSTPLRLDLRISKAGYGTETRTVDALDPDHTHSGSGSGTSGALVTVQTTAPSSPAVGDVWIDSDATSTLEHTHTGTDWTLRTGALWQNMPRNLVGVVNAALISGTLHLTAVHLTAGQTVTSITFTTGVTTVTPTNGWFALFDGNRVCLARSADSLTEVWTAFNFKTKAMTTPYSVTASGLYYAGAMYAAATPPSLMGIASNTGQSPTSLGSPILNGRSTTGMTTPPTPGSFTAAAPGGAIGTPWVEIS